MEEAVPHLVSMEHLSRFASVPSIFLYWKIKWAGGHTHTHTQFSRVGMMQSKQTK